MASWLTESPQIIFRVMISAPVSDIEFKNSHIINPRIIERELSDGLMCAAGKGEYDEVKRILGT